MASESFFPPPYHPRFVSDGRDERTDVGAGYKRRLNDCVDGPGVLKPGICSFLIYATRFLVFGLLVALVLTPVALLTPYVSFSLAPSLDSILTWWGTGTVGATASAPDFIRTDPERDGETGES